ncbi:leucyl aminopeptidase [Georgenia satyanarayanai]|uniref:Probable cytosol aminopeptidase n=1 Tax=Georgenia satyanarayanai TaxID=860221 RepID=A0A2Y8ZXS7_9MICO|nr:leucyl aminopeptidase [Georgenia satyanarayanai]PYG01982.1 leucyl aminopeptidase [Georgenia satyanarayanai]SSA36785.1 leucyl aminopeptidase [Georgenia satyanarayanai]
MTELTLTTKNVARIQADAVVVAVGRRGEETVLVPGADLPSSTVKTLTSLLPALGVSGKADEVLRVAAGKDLAADVVVLTGVGPVGEGGADLEALRRAAGAAVRSLAGTADVALALPAATAEQVGAVAEGALLGAYSFDRYRTTRTAPVARLELVSDVARSKEAKAAHARAVVVAGAVAGVRDLVNASPADLYPQSFAEEATAGAKGTKVKVTVLDEKELAAGGFGGLVGVGMGSARPPRLVKVTYSPARAKAHVGLVGKGITFDSGGLSIKPAKGMETMKMDMAGAATVLHTVLAAAALELPVRVTGWLALAENMPSSTAQRPSDVITIRGGKTVEVLNTDAEGRLVMADALVAAGEENPDLLIDIATLTGAQMVALGSQVGAVMGTDDVREEVVAAAGAAGEQFWPMPLPAELADSMKSQVADIANMGDRFGGMLVAGLFLKEFVGDTPWAHLDIAGPAFNEGSPRGYTPEGGTGMGVRTLLTVLEKAAIR